METHLAGVVGPDTGSITARQGFCSVGATAERDILDMDEKPQATTVWHLSSSPTTCRMSQVKFGDLEMEMYIVGAVFDSDLLATTLLTETLPTSINGSRPSSGLSTN